MKRKTAALAILILTVSAVLLLTACGNGSSKIIGQWEIQNAEEVHAPFDFLEFFSDNTYASEDPNYNGHYSIDGNRIKFDGILVNPITCSFKVNGKTLTLTNNDKTWKYTKTK